MRPFCKSVSTTAFTAGAGTAIAPNRAKRGVAMAIGVLVDAAIVMVENGYRHLSEAQHSGKGDKLGPRSISSLERRRILLDAAKQVGPALFFSLLIVSFLGSKPSSSDEERLEPFFSHRLTP